MITLDSFESKMGWVGWGGGGETPQFHTLHIVIKLNVIYSLNQQLLRDPNPTTKVI